MIRTNKATASVSATFGPRLDILPPAQRCLWPELAGKPDEFTLYGGTAIALRLGHRQSVDFDWLASVPFVPDALMRRVPYLRGASVQQSPLDILTVTVERGGPVQLSFFGGLDLGQVAPAEIAMGPGIKVGSLIDLAGLKAAIVTQRAEARDYIDVHALLTTAKIPWIGIGGSLAAPPLPHHRAYGSVHGGSRGCANTRRTGMGDRAI
jgi:Nucleotidyl transferase AbiEii toxin, Type IV TA system